MKKAKGFLEKLLIIAFCIFLTMFMCYFLLDEKTDSNYNTASNPVIELNSLESVEENVGFSFNVSEIVEENPLYSYIASQNKIAQVQFRKNQNNDFIVIRKSKTFSINKKTDISGVYKELEESEINVCSCLVNLKKEDDKTYVVYWTKNAFSYSISSTEGLTENEVLFYIEKLMKS